MSADEPGWAAEDLAEIDPTTLHGYDDRLLRPSLRSMVRGLPSGTGLLIRLAWQVSRLRVVGLVVAQLVGALATAAAFGFGVTSLTGLLTAGSGAQRVDLALPSLLLVTGALLVRSAAQLATRVIQADLVPELQRSADDLLHTAVVEADLVAFEDAQWFEGLTRARDRGLMYVELTAERLLGVLQSVGGLVAVLAVAVTLHPLVLALLACSVVPNAVAALRAARLGYASTVRLASLHHHQWLLRDLLTQRGPATEVRSCCAEPYLLGTYREISGEVSAERRRVERAQLRQQAAGAAISGLVTALTFVALVLLARTGRIPLAAAGVSVMAVRTAQGGMGQLVASFTVLYEYGLYLGDLGRFVADSAARRAPSGTAVLPQRVERIDLDRVGFRYPGCEQEALHEVSLTLRRGEVIALVGENGSGKTTLAKVLAGLYRPEQGRVSWDGVDLADADPAQVRDRVALMGQEVTRWPLTARWNIAVGRHDRVDPDGAALRRAAERSGASRIITSLPQGLRTYLSRHFRGGRELSTGQWQTLALARALYRDASLLICDEPTAALDARAEQRSYEAIRTAHAGVGDPADTDRTTVLITHRLASVRLADRIYVLDRGRVVEVGSHPELMRRGGLYAELYRLQAEGYRETGDVTVARAERIDCVPG